MVESHTFQTALGSIPGTGAVQPLTVLAINGLFARPKEMGLLPAALVPHGYGAVVTHLPGFGPPPLKETSLAAFARSFDEVADAIGPTVVLGHSLGALVAISMRSPNVRRVVAVEPVLEPVKLWQMGPTMVETFAEHADFYTNVFGFDGQVFHGRNYLDLLDHLAVPTDFVVGDQPMFPTRPASSAVYSTVDEAQRRLIQRSPNATLHIAPNSGHSVHRYAPHFLFEILLSACRAAE